MINKLKMKIAKNKLLQSILLITSGTVFGQAINVIFSPIITRVYSPEEYGVYTVFMSILLLFSFATFKYELAIPIAKDDKQAINVLSLSIIILAFSSVSIAIILGIFGETILTWLNATSLLDYRLFIPVGIFFYGLYLIVIQWVFRRKKFSAYTKSKMVQAMVGNVAKLITGLMGFGSNGLLLGTILNESLGSLTIISDVIKDDKYLVKEVKVSEMKSLAKRYISFPKFQTPSAIFLHLRNQIPVFFLTPIYGSQVVGFYGLANSIVKLPMMLIGQSVMDVFYAELASIGTSNSVYIKELSTKLTKRLLIIGFVPFIILLIGGPFLFSLFFGEQWTESGYYARYLSLYIYANLALSPVSKVFEVYEKQSIKMIIDIMSLIIVIFIFVVANVLNFTVTTTIILFSIVMTILYIVTYIAAQKILDSHLS